MPTARCQVANSTFTNSQLHLAKLQLHIVKSPFSHLHFYIANLTSLHYFTGCLKFSDCPPKNPLVAQFVFKVLFCPNFVFLGRFLLGWVGALHQWPTLLPPSLHTHLLRLPIHLPTYLGVGPYPHLPTIQDINSCPSSQVCKFTSLQIYKIKNSETTN